MIIWLLLITKLKQTIISLAINKFIKFWLNEWTEPSTSSHTFIIWLVTLLKYHQCLKTPSTIRPSNQKPKCFCSNHKTAAEQQEFIHTIPYQNSTSSSTGIKSTWARQMAKKNIPKKTTPHISSYIWKAKQPTAVSGGAQPTIHHSDNTTMQKKNNFKHSLRTRVL